MKTIVSSFSRSRWLKIFFGVLCLASVKFWAVEWMFAAEKLTDSEQQIVGEWSPVEDLKVPGIVLNADHSAFLIEGKTKEDLRWSLEDGKLKLTGNKDGKAQEAMPLMDVKVAEDQLSLTAIGKGGVAKTMHFKRTPKIRQRDYSKFTDVAKVRSAMRAAYQIHTALFAYAQNHDQEFPNGKFKDANAAYRKLFEAGVVDDERIFYVAGCAWHGGKKSDGNIGTKDSGFAEALAEGENHWAYVNMLTTDRDFPTLPIIADGFGEKVGRWGSDPVKPGGMWQGNVAIVVRIGGNMKIMDLNDEGGIKDRKEGKEMDIFSQEFGTTPENILNPLAPKK